MSQSKQRKALVVCFAFSGLLWLAACDSEPVTPIPTRTYSGPTIAPSEVFYPNMPTQESFNAGVNDPTAAAQPRGAQLPPLVIGQEGSEVESIQVTAGDGTQLTGDLYLSRAGDLAPGILLIAPSRSAWGDFPLRLAALGKTVLSMELRVDAPLGDALAMIDALANTQGVDPGKIAVVGAEAGADLALAACADDLLCDGLAMLTPLDVRSSGDLARYTLRPLWVAVSADDPARSVAEQLRLTAPDQVQLLTQPGNMRGASLITADSTLADALITFLSSLLS
ncbi:MAG: hypothetical protein U0670_03835 [Anaerolineae bacterium]